MTTDFEPIERITVSDEIIKQLISLINTGKLKPGSKLPSERELMEKFQVSRSPVREALRSLTMIGLLETIPGAGTYVCKDIVDIIGGQIDWSLLLGYQEVMELLEVREPLEIQAAGLAAENNSPESLENLRCAIEYFKECLDTDANLMIAEHEVHMSIARMSGNRVLIRFIHTFQDLLNDFRQKNQIGFSTNTSAFQDYMEIYQAIDQGDSEGARRGMARHMQSSKKRALVEQMNERTEKKD